MNKFLIVILCHLLIGCSTKLEQYHTDKSTNSSTHNLIESHPNYKLGFVEIDDKGSFWDRNQLKHIIKTINDESKDVLLLVYAHGWQHNADSNNRDVKRFKETLDLLANQENGIREVIGLYIGWRGMSLSGPYVKNLSFWERKETAHNAGDAATEIFIRLKKAMDNKKTNRSKSGMVVIGHSFGGALIFSALKPLMLSELNPNSKSFTNDQKIADLIVLLNPAFEATRFTELRNVFKPKKGSPYLVVLTADNDKATGIAFPAGRYLSTMFDKYKNSEQRSADRRTIGHYKPYTTHNLIDNDNVQGSGCGKFHTTLKLDDIDDKYKSMRLLQQNSTNNIDLYDSKIIYNDQSGINEKNPLQIIKVSDRDILDHHSNIMCDDLVDLIQRYIKFNSSYSVGDGS